MHAQKTPTAVRLLGFSPCATAHLATLLASAPRSGPLYACLHEDSLQEPDIVLADGTSPAALAWLDGMRCPPPALVIGGMARASYTQLSPPFEPDELYACMVKLLAERRRALMLLSARGEPLLAERRRRPRLGPDAGCPSERQPPRDGKVLIVDKGGAFRDHLAGLVGPSRLAIAWTDSAPMAVRLCDETPVSLAMINTAAPGIDPYGLSRDIKAQQGAEKTAVVLLVGRTFNYDSTLAHGAGVRGLLDKPVGDRSLVAMLQRLASLPEMPA
ncbi:response regulator [Massilia suwonensis]|uniref:Response regulator n=1 Tax=Massilia suwonensis TaxID=648895 RepID=A0ABW0MUF9_9BURK